MRRRRRHRRENKKQKRIMVIGICSIFLVMTAGYAAMQTEIGINAKGNVVKKTTGVEAILNIANIVSTGDGLYEDTYENNQYIYRGSNPNNYITYNGEQWRIVSINTETNQIKIIRQESLVDRTYDTTNVRYQGSSGYCNYSGNGCNIWGSSSTLYNASGRKITSLAYEIGGTAYTLPTAVSDLNLYLNETYLNSTLSDVARGQIEEGWFNVGPVSYSSSYSLSQNIEQSKAARWKGNIGLIDATEYVKVSTNSECDSVYDFWYNPSCYNNPSNYLHISDVFWTITPLSSSASSLVLYVTSYGNLSYYTGSFGVRPVVYLSPDIKITGGDGLQNNPYTIS